MILLIRSILIIWFTFNTVDITDSDMNNNINIISNTNKKKQIFGTATWYGRYFHGRKTANGEIYNMYGLTCATGNRTIPFGSKLKVTNIKTGKSITVRVNDRMNKRYHPVDYKGNSRIDLSVGAFIKLAPKEQGVIKIKYEIYE